MPEPNDYCLMNKIGLGALGFVYGIPSGILGAKELADWGYYGAEYLNDYF